MEIASTSDNENESKEKIEEDSIKGFKNESQLLRTVELHFYTIYNVQYTIYNIQLHLISKVRCTSMFMHDYDSLLVYNAMDLLIII